MLTARTRLVGLMGWPVTHSLSPQMHNAAFQALGLDYRYVAFSVSPHQLRTAVLGARALGMVGINITVPHKECVLEHLDDITPFAKRAGAVNTLWVGQDARIHGDNTDGPGLVNFVREAGARLRGAHALVLGAGGSARAVCASLVDAECKTISLLNRTLDRAYGLASVLDTPKCSIKVGRFPLDIPRFGPQADIIVNCTTCGMCDDALAWDSETPFRAQQVVCDLVYGRQPTPLLAMAKRQGARALDGRGMLVHQGALSFERWTGHVAPKDVMFQAVRQWEGA